MTPQTILGQPSWRIATPEIEAFVTVQGGHLGPVRVRLGDRTVEPFSVAPWAEERVDACPMIRTLRGDFFCMPFGGNETKYSPLSSGGEEGPPKGGTQRVDETVDWRSSSGGSGVRENHPQHGDTANLDWRLESLTGDEIHLSLETQTRPGRVDKRIRLEGTSILQSHTVSGMKGPMPVGHHAMLRFTSEGRFSTSPILHGHVFPGDFERPEQGGYTSLLPGARFDDLTKVPMQNGGLADLTHYPAREGFEDLVQLYHRPDLSFAWNAVVVDGYVWIALKAPRVLPATVLWHSNGGRHYAPWNGRHRRVLGVEDVCAYFHYGLAESAVPNDAPVPTSLTLDPEKPTEIRYAMAIAPVPDGFDMVERIEPTKGGVVAISPTGLSVNVSVELSLSTNAGSRP